MSDYDRMLVRRIERLEQKLERVLAKLGVEDEPADSAGGAALPGEGDRRYDHGRPRETQRRLFAGA